MWISVKDKLPERNKWVLAFSTDEENNDGEMVVDKLGPHYKDKNYQFYDSFYDEEITHWMPLPEPPSSITKVYPKKNRK